MGEEAFIWFFIAPLVAPLQLNRDVEQRGSLRGEQLRRVGVGGRRADTGMRASW